MEFYAKILIKYVEEQVRRIEYEMEQIYDKDDDRRLSIADGNETKQ